MIKQLTKLLQATSREWNFLFLHLFPFILCWNGKRILGIT